MENSFLFSTALEQTAYLLILGKMGHSERYGATLYKTNTIKVKQDIFKNGVNYFKGEK